MESKLYTRFRDLIEIFFFATVMLMALTEDGIALSTVPSCRTKDRVCYLSYNTTMSCKLEGDPTSCSNNFGVGLLISGTPFRQNSLHSEFVDKKNETEIILHCLEEGCKTITWSVRCGFHVQNFTSLWCVQGFLGPILNLSTHQDQGGFVFSWELPTAYYGLRKWFEVRVWKDGAVCAVGRTNDTSLQIENHTCTSGSVEVTISPWNPLGMGENKTVPYFVQPSTLSKFPVGPVIGGIIVVVITITITLFIILWMMRNRPRTRDANSVEEGDDTDAFEEEENGDYTSQLQDDDNGLPESVQETDMKSSGYVVTPDHKMNMRSSPVLRYSRNGNAMPEEQPPSPISSDVKGFDMSGGENREEDKSSDGDGQSKQESRSLADRSSVLANTPCQLYQNDDFKRILRESTIVCSKL